MRRIPTPAIFLRNVTDDEWISSRAGMDVLAESLYILAPVVLLLLLAAAPFGQPQVSWDACLDVYGPASKSTDAPRIEDRRKAATLVTRNWAVRLFNALRDPSSLLAFSAFWALGASRERSIVNARTSQLMSLRLLLLLAIPAVATYATLSLDYSGEGLCSMLLNCVMHWIDVAMIVFGDTPLSFETWG